MPSSVSEKKSGSPVWAYLLTAAAAIGLTYGIMKYDQGGSDQKMSNISIVDPVNSDINIIELKDSQLHITGPYHVGKNTLYCGNNGCLDTSAYQKDVPVVGIKKRISVKKKIIPVKKKKTIVPDTTTIDDCVNCAGGNDLWQNKKLLDDLKISAEENEQYKLK